MTDEFVKFRADHFYHATELNKLNARLLHVDTTLSLVLSIVKSTNIAAVPLSIVPPSIAADKASPSAA